MKLARSAAPKRATQLKMRFVVRVMSLAAFRERRGPAILSVLIIGSDCPPHNARPAHARPAAP